MNIKPIIIIPARMDSQRLYGKPLADIAGKPMIMHVYEKAVQANVADVVVACADTEIVDAVKAHGGQAIMTRNDHATGTDRIYEALQNLGGDYDIIVNVQGDLPLLSPDVITQKIHLLERSNADIGTLAVKITDTEELTNPNVVKAIIALDESGQSGRALYFTRSTLYGEGYSYHHIGLYIYRKEALERFVALPQSALEKRERLEQLRALEAGMRIDVALVDSEPLGVDTPEDLEKVRALLR